MRVLQAMCTQLGTVTFGIYSHPVKFLIWHHYTTLHTTVLPLLIFAKSHLWVWISYRGLECNCVWLEKTDSQRIYVSLQRSWVPFVRHVRILKISNILHAYEIFYKEDGWIWRTKYPFNTEYRLWVMSLESALKLPVITIECCLYM